MVRRRADDKINLELEITSKDDIVEITGPLNIEGGKFNGSELLGTGVALGNVIGNFIPFVSQDERLMQDFVNAVCKPFEEYAKGANKN